MLAIDNNKNFVLNRSLHLNYTCDEVYVRLYLFQIQRDTRIKNGCLRSRNYLVNVFVRDKWCIWKRVYIYIYIYICMYVCMYVLKLLYHYYHSILLFYYFIII